MTTGSWLPSWVLFLSIVVVFGVVVAAAMTWALWPIQCDSTAIGSSPGEPDPNLYMCSTRVGTVTQWETAKMTAVLWGQTSGVAVIAVVAVARWFRRLR